MFTVTVHRCPMFTITVQHRLPNVQHCPAFLSLSSTVSNMEFSTSHWGIMYLHIPVVFRQFCRHFQCLFFILCSYLYWSCKKYFLFFVIVHKKGLKRIIKKKVLPLILCSSLPSTNLPQPSPKKIIKIKNSSTWGNCLCDVGAEGVYLGPKQLSLSFGPIHVVSRHRHHHCWGDWWYN